MIRRLLTTLAITFVLLSGTVHSAFADTRIAYVDVDGLFNSSAWVKKRVAEAQAKRDKLMEPLLKERAALARASTDLDKQAGTLKADDLKRKRDELEVRAKALVERVMSVDTQFTAETAKIRADLLARVKIVAAALVKEGKYDYCLDAAALFAGPAGSDVTKDVGARVDAIK